MSHPVWEHDILCSGNHIIMPELYICLPPTNAHSKFTLDFGTTVTSSLIAITEYYRVPSVFLEMLK